MRANSFIIKRITRKLHISEKSKWSKKYHKFDYTNKNLSEFTYRIHYYTEEKKLCNKMNKYFKRHVGEGSYSMFFKTFFFYF